MTSPTARQPRSLRIPVVIGAIVVLIVAWISLTTHLAVMSRTGLNHIENIFRGFLISHHVLSPEWKHYQPPAWDMLQHFVFYAPFGIFAGVVASCTRRWQGAVAARFAEVATLAVGFTVALMDELRQDGLPDRLPGFDDLFSGWAGIAASFACYLAGGWFIARRRARVLTNHKSRTTLSQ